MSTLSSPQHIETLIAQGDLDTAAQDCIQLVKQAPQNGDAWLLLSKVSVRLKQNRMAVNSALKALEIAPDQPAYLLHLSQLYAGFSAWQATRKVLQKLNAMTASLDSHTLTALAKLYFQSGHIQQAIAVYQQVITAEPDNHEVLYNLGSLYRYTGELNRSATCLAAALAIKPNDYQACSALAHVKKHHDAKSVIANINKCMADYAGDDSSTAAHARASLHYAKGKVLEDSKQWQAAFTEYSAGAELKKSLQAFTTEQEIQRIAAMQALVHQGYFKAAPAEAADGPVFVVGMPRTGTTVVERILASHSRVTSGGELNFFPMTLLEAGGSNWFTGPEGVTPEVLEKVAKQDMAAIGERYMALARDYLNTQGVFIDKLPLNALFVPIILSALPNARIIQVQRNAMDTAFSNFKMLFNRGYEYSYSLEDIGAYLPAYQSMMQQWQDSFPEQILTVSYEQLTANPEHISREILSFCQLDWEAACLQFHIQAGATQTASASQVIEPLHNRYVGQWQQFKEPLVALKSELARQGVSPLTEEDIKW
tara:strand:- start:1897 stop:3510 length:1614 start_codon:yes stop_codon:yes gene_type:complete